MASPSSFNVDDQTDEDFFNNLVCDDFAMEGSRCPPKGIVRDFSNLNLDDMGTSLEDTDDAGSVPDPQRSGTLRSSESPEDVSATEDSVPFDSSVGHVVPSESSSANTPEIGQQSLPTSKDVTKGTGVKTVQWSAFSINSSSNDNVGLETHSDFFADDVDSSFKSSTDLNFTLVENQIDNVNTYSNSLNTQDTQLFSSATEQNTDGFDAQYWENLYPGWKYNTITGQWYQVDAAMNNQGDSSTVDSQGNFTDGAHAACSNSMHVSSDDLYLQQTSQSVLETIAEESTLNATNWNLGYQKGIEYPPNMVFDPLYPGWYYDTNAQQWYTLDSYTQTSQMIPPVVENETVGLSEGNYTAQSEVGQPEQNNGVLSSQEFGEVWNSPTSSYSQENWQAEQVGKSTKFGGSSGNQQTGSFYSSGTYSESHADHSAGIQTFMPTVNYNFGSVNATMMPHNSVQGGGLYQMNHQNVAHDMHKSLSSSFTGNQNSFDYSQHSFQEGNDYSEHSFQDTKASYSSLSYSPLEGRSAAGRPAHALVSFGFGGKLIVMKNANSSITDVAYGSQKGTSVSAVSVLNLSEVIMKEVKASSVVSGTALDYLHSLCHQSFPGPLVGGSAATKDINKWLDERILSYEAPVMEFNKGKLLKVLLSLLKISLQHYGKLRSPFGSDPSIEEVNGPEMAVTKLFASSKTSGAPFGEYGSYTRCLINIPSESQLQVTAAKVQTLLVSGKRKEALHCAQEGQLWGPALVLAAQLGDKFYIDMVKKMAHHQFTFGSPLRSLCLLIAGQPADVFSTDGLANSLSMISPKQPAEIQSAGMLDLWEENLAIITANRTKDDELVIIHLGDCLWKEKGEITAAHICYLVAEANIEPYSDAARLCLIGADHLQYPRTYATPDAIQRTELYEHSKVLGNSQFILLPFQPYKIIYAYMLAEVGKISDSLRYCQAVSKLLKSSGRTSDIEMWKSLLSSLEDRIRTHQQGGYGSSLAPANLVGKLFTTFDRSIHRMIGSPASPNLPPLPPMPQGSVNIDKETHTVPPKVGNSQSTMAMSTLVPSASEETMDEWDGDDDKMAKHNRSISEPDFGRSPKQNSNSDGAQSKASISGGSRFGRIGSQLLQKTMGWVSRSHRQAKLGESNRFYYDEKLKRWVEEGAAPPAEEPALPPPPTSSFQNGISDYNINNAFKSDSTLNDASKRESLADKEGPATKPLGSLEHSSGIPPAPSTQNQFSARGRMGVRSRYVDTFNKGGGGAASVSTFQSPAAPSAKPLVGAKFFMPTAVPVTAERQVTDTGDSSREATGEEPPKPAATEASLSPPSPPTPTSLQRYQSMDNITLNGNTGSEAPAASWNGDGPLPLSRSRAASWSGSCNDPTKMTMFVPGNTLKAGSTVQQNGSTLGDDLHEVEL